MPAWLLSLLGPLGGWLLKLVGLFINKPSPVVVEAEKAGSAQQQAADAQAQATTEAAIAQAEADAPKTVQGDEDRLNKGTF